MPLLLLWCRPVTNALNWAITYDMCLSAVRGITKRVKWSHCVCFELFFRLLWFSVCWPALFYERIAIFHITISTYGGVDVDSAACFLCVATVASTRRAQSVAVSVFSASCVLNVSHAKFPGTRPAHAHFASHGFSVSTRYILEHSLQSQYCFTITTYSYGSHLGGRAGGVLAALLFVIVCAAFVCGSFCVAALRVCPPSVAHATLPGTHNPTHHILRNVAIWGCCPAASHISFAGMNL